MLTFCSRSVQEAPLCVSRLCLTRGIMGVEVHSIQECGFDEGMWLFAVVALSQLETHLWASWQIKAAPSSPGLLQSIYISP